MSLDLSRRHALGLMIATLALPACSRAREGAISAQGAMSAPSLIRAGLIHDALTLLASDRDITGEWQDMLMPLPKGKVFEFAYTYGVASLGPETQLVHDVVTEAREGWEGRQEPFMDIQRHKRGMLERRLSVALGWAANKGASDVLFARTSDPLALDGAFIRALLGVRSIPRDHARRIFRLLYERAFIAMHTIEPDLDGLRDLDIAAHHEVRPPAEADVNRFMDDYAAWAENIDIMCDRLADAAASGTGSAPEGTALYDRADPVIAAASGFRVGLGTAQAPGGWAEGGGASLYAEALSRAYGHARLVLEAARGDVPAEALTQAFPL